MPAASSAARIQAAKVCRPQLPPLHPRPRVFAALDRFADRPALWVAAPAGAGKTTAILSYLEARGRPFAWYDVDAGDADPATLFHYLSSCVPEARDTPLLPRFSLGHRAGVAVFARRFFEALFARLPPGGALVMDNCQELPPEAPTHELLREAIEVVPAGVRLVLVSRGEPPRAFARALANGRIGRAGWEDLRFSEEEAAGLLSVRSAGRGAGASRARAAEIQRVTDGWAAGMILLMEGASANPQRSVGAETTGLVFDYFASEVLDHMEPPVARLLMATALLPSVTEAAAQALTGAEQAGRILAQLHRQNLFTVRRDASPPAFVYHSLFRAFLLQKAEERMAPDELRALRERAARVLAEAGQAHEALEVLRRQGDWAGALPIILENAGPLVARAQIPTLQAWLEWIPEVAFEQVTWLLFWKATATLLDAPAASQPLWRRSFERFRAEGDTAGVFLAAVGAMQAITFEERDFAAFDPWLDELGRLEDAGTVPPSPEIEARVASSALFALVFRVVPPATGARYLRRAERAFAAAQSLDDQLMLGGSLVFYHALKGERREAEKVLIAIEPLTMRAENPLPRLQCLYAKAFLFGFGNMAPAECFAAVDEGIRISLESGVGLFLRHLAAFGTMAAVALGDRPIAERYLRVLQTPGPITPFLEAFRTFAYSWFSLEFEGAEAARSPGQPYVQLLTSVNYGPVAFAYQAAASAACETGQWADAARHLDTVEAMVAGGGHPPHALAGARFLRAGCLLGEGQVSAARAALAEALPMIKVARPLYDGWIVRRTLARLCSFALEAGIEPDLVREMITRRRLVPPGEASATWAWPVPVRLMMLGRFELWLDGAPRQFPGRSPRVPLRLLKATAAAGPGGMAHVALMEMLWPEAEADAAGRAFDTTLHRLRKLLGHDGAVVSDDGVLRLGRDHGAVDAFALEPLAAEIDALLARGAAASDPLLGRKIEALLDLYRGDFLPGDEDLPVVLRLRERLRRVFVRTLVGCGERHEAEGRREEALALYLRGLAADESAEPLYRRAIACHAALGQNAEAVRLYETCRESLRRLLDVEPAAETRRLYEGLRPRRGQV